MGRKAQTKKATTKTRTVKAADPVAPAVEPAKPGVEGTKEALRLLLFGVAGYLVTWTLENWIPGLPQTQTTAVLTLVLRFIDKFIHENPADKRNGLLWF